MSVYRGDLEATQARIVALEDELTALRARHAEALDRLRARQARLEADLEGRVPQPPRVRPPPGTVEAKLTSESWVYAVGIVMAMAMIILALGIILEHCGHGR